MCEFCENIEVMHFIKQGAFKGQYLPDTNRDQIVKDGNQYHIWSDGGGDSFQAGICVEDIAYCPKCGRKL